MLCLLLPAVACVCTGCPVFQNQDTPVSHIRKTEATCNAEYCLYVPSNYNPDQPMPLIVTLHGTHGFDSATDQVNEWKSLAEAHGFIVLAPQLVSPQGILPVAPEVRRRDVATDEARILAMVKEVRGQYNIAADSIGLTGFSGAGYALYPAGLAHPDLFAAVVARECSFDMDLLKDFSGPEAGKKMPILIFCGKTSINPGTSRLNPIIAQSHQVQAWLLEHGYKKVEFRMTEGGHYRRPEMAFEYFKKTLPQFKRQQ